MTRARRRGSSPLAAEQLAATEAHAELLPKDLSAVRRYRRVTEAGRGTPYVRQEVRPEAGW